MKKEKIKFTYLWTFNEETHKIKKLIGCMDRSEYELFVGMDEKGNIEYIDISDLILYERPYIFTDSGNCYDWVQEYFEQVYEERLEKIERRFKELKSIVEDLRK